MKRLIVVMVLLAGNLVLFSQVPTGSLVGYWPFNGNANDYSGNSNNGSVNGATLTADRFGNANSAYSFDGINDNIVVANSPNTDVNNSTDFSISFWLKTYTNPTMPGEVISNNLYGSWSGYSFFTNGTNPGYCNSPGNLSFYCASGGGGDACANNAIAGGSYLNTWINICGVFDSGVNQSKLYVNGVLQTDIGSASGILSNNVNLVFGSHPTNINYYKGAIDDIRIYKRKLTQTEINSLVAECGSVVQTPVSTTPPGNQSICSNTSASLSVAGTGTLTWYSSPTSTQTIGTGNSFVTPPLAAGTYTFYAQNAYCTYTSAILPRTVFTVTSGGTAAGISVNSGTICPGQSFTIVPSGATSYNYSGGGPVVTPITTTDYTVTGISACGNGLAISHVVVNSPAVVVNGNNYVCKGSPINFLAAGNVQTYTWSTGGNGNLITLTPTANIVFTLSGTDANGCIAAVSKTITVNPLPLVHAFANDTLICEGKQAVLYGGGASSYVWTGGVTNNNPFFLIVSSGYTVTGTDGNGCQNTDFINLTVHSLPVITVNSSTNLICAGETITLTSQGAITYTWNNGSNGPVIMVNPVITTTYAVTGTDAYGCSDKTTITAQVNACTGLKQVIANSKELSIYPNPTTGEFIMETQQEREVMITNALGQIVLKQHLNEGENKIDLGKYAKGIYFIQLKKDSTTEITKLIKN